MEADLIFVQKPVDKSRLTELLDNVPVSVLTASYEAVKWLDEIKRAANELKLES
jgi:hypothetical protein